MPIWLEQLRGILSMRAATHAALPDLRQLPSARARVEGTHFVANDPERRHRADRPYVLRRQRRRGPAIAVFAQGRNIGYVAAARAAALAPLLDELGGAALVNGVGASPRSTRLWMDLPTDDALSRYVMLYPTAGAETSSAG
ncbi:hypothetical protein N3K63_01410 [Microbacterium sp. W1N]|uniref:hypothetical protein n=1 Tax=Microbacterium festucae TaxID=2977531 RepID=UPI0021C112E6|nr:hypothetical protein [Microbacterium festucae]MCT9818937.1 hypothetical protein [Microbacterium festucae]